ncbi:uncharacterized protein LOC107482514 [Arachis duranensis]|uniref:Uncharacterized protein LOC107482514 n=1 Tax=Arachis duranensis TaxID=130453 RepID=A0A9C6WR40_ARADU|nr:uncharacterized protein LOC107482514 [Arachis duranensis]
MEESEGDLAAVLSPLRLAASAVNVTIDGGEGRERSRGAAAEATAVHPRAVAGDLAVVVDHPCAASETELRTEGSATHSHQQRSKSAGKVKPPLSPSPVEPLPHLTSIAVALLPPPFLPLVSCVGRKAPPPCPVRTSGAALELAAKKKGRD